MAKRKARAAAKPAAMAAGRFWKLVEAARRADDFVLALSSVLEKLPADEIIGFQTTLHQYLARAYRFPLLAANFIIQSYVSDDVFEDFRAWLVSQGRERYVAAVADPESICDWLERSAVDGIDGQSVLLAA